MHPENHVNPVKLTVRKRANFALPCVATEALFFFR